MHMLRWDSSELYDFVSISMYVKYIIFLHYNAEKIKDIEKRNANYTLFGCVWSAKGWLVDKKALTCPVHQRLFCVVLVCTLASNAGQLFLSYHVTNFLKPLTGNWVNLLT
jgi:hypothetical protein